MVIEGGGEDGGNNKHGIGGWGLLGQLSPVHIMFYVFRSNGSPPRKDDHTYLASTLATTTDELTQPLPFRQTMLNRCAEG